MEDCFEYTLAAVVIVKDEAPYIAEWLDYHLAAGIEHFYLYDNDSNDNLREILQPYIASGKIDYKYYPGKYLQIEAYNDAIRQHKFDAKYIAFFDVDEFILPLQGERILDIVEDTFKLNNHIAGLAINCKSFGSSGHKQKPETGGVLENYLHRAPDGYTWSELPWKWDAHVKTIVNPRRVLDYSSPHNPTYFLDFYSANEQGERVTGNDNFTNEIRRIRVNHYFTKSQDEWLKKRNKGLCTGPGIRPMEEFHWRDRNDVYDDAILKYREFCRTHQPIENHKLPTLTLAQRFAKLYNEMIQRPNPDDWKNRLGNLMQYYGIYRRILRQKNETDWQVDLWRDLVFAAMSKSLQSNVLDTYSIELVASMWQEIAKEPGLNPSNFRKLYVFTLQRIIQYYRSNNNIELERYFSDGYYEILKQSDFA